VSPGLSGRGSRWRQRHGLATGRSTPAGPLVPDDR
jgi:hypothetical protein